MFVLPFGLMWCDLTSCECGIEVKI